MEIVRKAILLFLCLSTLILCLSFVIACKKPSNDKVQPHDNEHVLDLTLNEILEIAVKRKNLSISLQKGFQKDTAAIAIIEQYRKIDGRFDSITKIYEGHDILQYDSAIWHPILFAENINLDGDTSDEIVMFIGYHLSAPEMIVFDKIGDSYQEIGSEHLWMHNEYPEYEIVKKGNKNIIKTTQFYIRGSGAWLKVHHYYEYMDSVMQLIFKAPSSANMSLGSSGLYLQGNLFNDSVYQDGLQLSYVIDAAIDRRFISDTSEYDQIEVYKEEVITTTYKWNKKRKTYLADGIDVAGYLLNINNDTCVYEFLKPELIKMNNAISRSFIKEYRNAKCRLEQMN